MTARRALLAGALGAVIPDAARAESRFYATSDGVLQHYLQAGEGPTLLFVPGWCMPAWNFRPRSRRGAIAS